MISLKPLDLKMVHFLKTRRQCGYKRALLKLHLGTAPAEVVANGCDGHLLGSRFKKGWKIKDCADTHLRELMEAGKDAQETMLSWLSLQSETGQ